MVQSESQQADEKAVELPVEVDNPAGEKELESLVFSPPVYRQRYHAVGETVKKFQAKKVLDFGCAEAKLMRYLISEENSIENIVGVDIDGDLLEMNKHRIKPLTSDFLMPRPSPLTVSLYQGSIAEADKRFCDFDVVACVELIEHLFPPVLAMVPSVLLGQLSPRVAIVTTPNVEFNVLFNRLAGFRHWDHKFEWTRAQFEDWATDAAKVYGYSVSFSGIGEGPEESEALGCCSQMAVFQRDDSQGSYRVQCGDIGQPYVLIAKADHPYRKYKISEEQEILYEIEHQLWFLNHRQEDSGDESGEGPGEEYEDSPKSFSLEWLIGSSTLSRLCGTIDRLRSVVKEDSRFKLNEAGDAILWKPPESEWSSDENDWDDNEWNDELRDTRDPSKCHCDTTRDPDTWTSDHQLTTEQENWDEENWDEENWDTDQEWGVPEGKEDCVNEVCWDSVEEKDKFWGNINPGTSEAVDENQRNNEDESDGESYKMGVFSYTCGRKWRAGVAEPASSDEDWDVGCQGGDDDGICWITPTNDKMEAT